MEQLKSCLHHTKVMRTNPPNSHMVFVDSQEEGKRILYAGLLVIVSSAAESYRTAHEAAKKEAKKKRKIGREGDGEEGGGSSSCYKELNQRLQRCSQLRQVSLKMKTQKDLMVGVNYR